MPAEPAKLAPPAQPSAAAPTARRRGRRRDEPDPWRPLDVLAEEERDGLGGGEGGADGGLVRWLTVFLAGAECPYGCVFCDLWRHTLSGPTPPGAIPAQLRLALAEMSEPEPAGVKLYNASNWFAPRAVPPADDEAVAALLAPRFRRALVECHPRLVSPRSAETQQRCLAFARRLAAGGCRLEVAMGLETVHPQALPRLGKSMTLDDFDRAAAALLEAGCGVRAFVLVGAPWVPPAETAHWAARSAAHAFAAGAGHVCLIPVRGDTPEMEALRAAGAWTPPRLADLETALDEALAAAPERTVATADLWDLDRFLDCAACAPRRRERLGRVNRSGRPEPRVACDECGGTAAGSGA